MFSRLEIGKVGDTSLSNSNRFPISGNGIKKPFRLELENRATLLSGQAFDVRALTVLEDASDLFVSLFSQLLLFETWPTVSHSVSLGVGRSAPL